MSWSEQVFMYCERGLDSAFWAEPFNALSNGAFLVVAGAASARLGATAPASRDQVGQRLALWTLIALTGAIGVGSFLFHTFATRWALLADVGPITLFMLAYLAYALRIFLGLGWLAIVLILPAFLLAGSAASSIVCSPADASGHQPPCLNGSLGYAPALVSLWIIGLVAWRRGLGVRLPLLAAGAVFLLSAALRTIDRDACEAARILGHDRGTHFLWHLLNALTLHLLLRAAIEDPHARQRSSRDAAA